MKVSLSLEEVATGVEKQINLTRQQGCATCNASGAAPGSQAEKCSTCGGVGQVQQVARTIFGQQMTVTACPNCGGEGTIVSSPCRDCNGEGRVRGRSSINVRIPAGVQEGNYIPLRGEGEIGIRGGASGDLLVFIEEKEHSHFQKKVMMLSYNYLWDLHKLLLDVKWRFLHYREKHFKDTFGYSSRSNI